MRLKLLTKVSHMANLESGDREMDFTFVVGNCEVRQQRTDMRGGRGKELVL